MARAWEGTLEEAQALTEAVKASGCECKPAHEQVQGVMGRVQVPARVCGAHEAVSQPEVANRLLFWRRHRERLIELEWCGWSLCARWGFPSWARKGAGS